MSESASPPGQAAAPISLASGGFVGRQREMALLRQQVDAAFRGEGSLVFITGEAGIGKTRLAREVRHYASELGFLWLEGRYLRDENIPFQPWVEAIRVFLHMASPAMLEKALQPHGAALATLVPEVAQHLGSVPPLSTIGPEEERLRLFEALAGVFTGIARQQPLVLFLDDLQWAPSIDALHHAARRAAAERWLLLGAYRDAELEERPALAKIVLAMNRERLFHHLPLKRLEEKDVARLVARDLGEAASATLAELVYEKTEGNPFFVEEVVRYLTEGGAITLMEGGWQVADPTMVHLPRSVKAVVGERLERLGEEARGVLTWASVAGHEFSLPLLRVVTGLEEEKLPEVVDKAVAASVLAPHPSLGQEVYAFVDEVVRDVLYEGIGPARRRRYHLRVGQGTEEIHSRRLEEHYEALAHHFLEGNALEKAAEYSVKAGDRSSSVYSWERAIKHYGTALELLEELEGDPRQQAEVLEKMARVTGLSQLQGAVGYWERALSLYEALVDSKKAGEVHLRLGAPYGLILDRTRAYPHSLKAVALLEAEGETSQLAQGLAFLGYHAAHGFGLRSSAVPLLEKGLALAERLGDAMGLIEAARLLGHVLVYHTGELARGLQVYQRALEEAKRAGNLVALSETAILMAREYGFLRDTEGALASAEQAEAAAKQAGIFRGQIEAALVLAWGCYLRGDASRALSGLDTAQQLARRGGIELNQLAVAGGIQVFPWWLQISLGEWQKAETGLLQLEELAQQTHSPPLRLFWVAPALAWLYLERGDLGSAKARLEEAATFAQSGMDNPPELLARALQVRVACGLGELEEAKGHMRRAKEIFSLSPDWLGLAAEVYLAEGVLATAEKRWPEAEAAFQKAVEINRQYHLPYYEARSLLEWGEMYRSRNGPGDREHGMGVLEQALAIFQRIQAKKMVEKVVALQEKVLAQPRRGPDASGRIALTYPDGLTQREVEVLRLIAAGKSNREIAEELFISLNTVGHHVSNILSKTGTANRAGVATYAARQGLS